MKRLFDRMRRCLTLLLLPVCGLVLLLTACGPVDAPGSDTASTDPVTDPAPTEAAVLPDAPGIDDFYRDFDRVVLRERSHVLTWYCVGGSSFDVTVTAHASIPDPGEAGETVVSLTGTDRRSLTLDMTAGYTYRVTVRAYGQDGAVSPDTTAYITCSPCLIEDSEIERVCAECEISRDSDAYRALCDINDVYYDKLTSRMKREVLIFFFEGVGDSYKRRFSAMCVVVRDGKIAFCDTRSSTAPDYPFDPSRNNGKDMGIVVDGIYKYTTVDHNGQYASLNINTPHLVRFHDEHTFYTNDNGYGFDIHRRYSNGPAPKDADWVNSAGCFLVGMAGSGPYTPFVKAVGLIPEDAPELTVAQKQVSGHVVIDRYYAVEFLTSIGYPDEAIALIREGSLEARGK